VGTTANVREAIKKAVGEKRQEAGSKEEKGVKGPKTG